MIAIIRNSLKDNNEEKLKEFNSIIEMAFGLTEKKRFYISDYGYGNVREVLLGKQDKLIRGQNWDKFYLDNIIFGGSVKLENVMRNLNKKVVSEIRSNSGQKMTTFK